MKQDEQEAFFEVFNELAEDLPDIKSQPLDAAVDDFIIDKIKDALKENNNNQTHASNCLGIKRTTLIAMCKRLKIF